MEKTQPTPLKFNKGAFGIATLVVLITVPLLAWKLHSVEWNKESLQTERWWSVATADFMSGVIVAVLPDQKLTIFIGDGEDDEVFDHIISHGSGGALSDPHGSGSASVGREITLVNQHGKITLKLLDGKCNMEVSPCGTKLILPDGRQFNMDGITPLWLRCKSDGTVIKLDELPKGFGEYMESLEPDDWGIKDVKIRSHYPDAFRKTE